MKFWKWLSILSVVVGFVMLAWTIYAWGYLNDLLNGFQGGSGILLIATNLRILLRARARA